MEQPISSLTFTRSIPEAITEAKRQKKLFVVYISGKNTETAQLEQSMWTDSNVGDCIAKYCVLLHITGGSTDGYADPHKSAPCIAVIGYNGVSLWQNEGFVNAENLVSSIQKAWLSLHIQETAASVFIASLTSQNPDTSTVSSSNVHGDSSNSNALAQAEGNAGSSSTELTVHSEILDESDGHEYAIQGTSTEPRALGYTGEPSQDDLKGVPGKDSSPVSETGGGGKDSSPATSASPAVWTSKDKFVESSAQCLDTRGTLPGSPSEETSHLVYHGASVGSPSRGHYSGKRARVSCGASS